MTDFECPQRRVRATVQMVLPTTGLAYVEDEHQAVWGITKSMRGVGLDQLRTGQQLELTVQELPSFSWVSGYAPLD